MAQSMSRKGSCIDNAAAGQVFGHVKDELFRGRVCRDFWTYTSSAGIRGGRQVKLKGLTPMSSEASPLWRSLNLGRPSFGAQLIHYRDVYP